MPPERNHARPHDRLRPCRIRPAFTTEPPGSALVEWGRTLVLCTVSAESGVPPFREGERAGWLTAEYAMLPGSGDRRKPRGADGRAREIGRMIGRTLRASLDLDDLGPLTLRVDCDVLQAHGGTRTASVTGAWVALALAMKSLGARGWTCPPEPPRQVAAVSVGLVGGVPLLDLDRDEDQAASVDMNVVMNADGGFHEIQGASEKGQFSPGELEAMLALARKGLTEIFALQTQALEQRGSMRTSWEAP